MFRRRSLDQRVFLAFSLGWIRFLAWFIVASELVSSSEFSFGAGDVLNRVPEVPQIWLCPKVILYENIIPPLTEVEKRLVCGDFMTSAEAKSTETESPWEVIPYSQSIYHLRIFLQDRAYHHPQFEFVMALDQLWVRIGAKTLLRRVSLEDGNEWVSIHKKRGLLGRPVTPDLLNELEKYATEGLKKGGYPCALVRAEANSELGEIVLRVKKGDLGSFGRVKQDPVAGLSQQILRRYDAFKIGDRFDGDLLSLTENRTSSSGLIENTRFSTQCSGSSFGGVEQSVISGAPRLMMGRVGLNTEGVLLGSFAWRNTRLGKLGSFLDFSVFGSARRQSVVAAMNLYYDQSLIRSFFAPQLSFIHRNESQFENLETNVQVGWSTTEELGGAGWSYFFGPVLNLSKTLRGLGAIETQMLSWEGRIGVKSHDFELYSDRPRSGHQAEVIVDLSHASLLSQVTAQRVRIKGESIWNLWGFDPPLWLVGLRAVAASTIASRLPNGDLNLPADLYQYLGGSRDLRGFGRLEISESARGGSLSSVYVGTELRLGSVIPYGFDPFVFFDFGKLGSQSFGLDSPWIWSPGFGLRWASPVGTVRGTVAHGFSDLNARHWQFYFSFGEEF
jgi:translocation and assembly module TamA